MRHSAERIYTTHVGSLPRPAALLDLMKAAAEGRPVELALRAEAERLAVADAVARQHAAGGGHRQRRRAEQDRVLRLHRPAAQRLASHARTAARSTGFKPEIDAFPEYYEQYLKSAMTGGTAAPAVPLGCTGPVTYIGQEQLWRDLANLRAAVGDAADPDDVFRLRGRAERRRRQRVLRHRGGVRGGDGGRAARRVPGDHRRGPDPPGRRPVHDRRADRLDREPKEETRRPPGRHRGDQPRAARDTRDRVRHTCYGINDGPRVHDAPLSAVIEACSPSGGRPSFEAANPRHEHVYRLVETAASRPARS